MDNVGSQEQVDALNQVLVDFSQQARFAFDQHNYVLAHQLVTQVLNLVPNHPIALSDLAIAELRLGYYESAYQNFITALEASGDQVSINLYDGLTETCYFLGKAKEQKKYGRLAVEMRKNEVIDEPFLALPNYKAPIFNSNNPKENIISYSLYGTDVRYCEYAVLNAQRALEIYPEWRCRFYVDDTVPRHVVSRLIQFQAQIVFVNEEMKSIHGLFCRFLVIDDPNVKRFLIRDADSLLSYREKMAVEEWIRSEKWFHTMHDSKDHVELMLAGMWGGCTGIFSNTLNNIHHFVESQRYMSMNVVDQHYLRYCIWPTVKQSVFINDSQGYDLNGVKFNSQANLLDRDLDEAFYVGRVEINKQLILRIQEEGVDIFTWVLKDEDNNQICFYDFKSSGRKEVEILMPDHYIENILSGKWSLSIL